MKRRCLIICAYNAYTIRDAVTPREGDFILCADGGYRLAQQEGIHPDLVIGDFDSCAQPQNVDFAVITLSPEKDDTDTMACIKHGIELGFEEFLIVGGIGGRLDQTLANIQALGYAASCGKAIAMTDKKNYVTLLENGSMQIPRREGFKLSLLAYSEVCRGVWVSGVKYALNDAILNDSFPLGVSNEFTADFATVSVREGRLLVMLSRD